MQLTALPMLSLTLLLLLFIVCDWGLAQQVELSPMLGPAKLCARNEHSALMFSFNNGKPLHFNLKCRYAAVKHVFVTTYFSKTLSNNFLMYACIIEIESIRTYM